MTIEKEFQTSLKTKKNHLEKNSKKVFQLQNWLETHRLNSRQKIKSLEFNFSTFLTLAPLGLGFSHFFIHQLTPTKKTSFFEKNLPVFQTFHPKIKFETIDYVNQFNSVEKSFFTNTLKDQLKKEQLEDTEFFFYDSTLLCGQPLFLAQVPTISESEHPTKTEKHSIEIMPSRNFVVSEGVHNLDELPSYLNALNHSITLGESLKFSPQPSLSETIGRVTEQTNFKTTSFDTKKNLSGLKFFSSSDNFQSNLHLVKQSKKSSTLYPMVGWRKIFKNLSKNLIRKNTFYKNQDSFYNQANLFRKQVEDLFLENNLSYIPNPGSLESKSFKAFLSPCASQIIEQSAFQINLSSLQQVPQLPSPPGEKTLREPGETYKGPNTLGDKLLEDLQKNQISADYLGSRTMSGFRYPDMNKSSVHYFLRKKLLSPFSFNFIFSNKQLENPTQRQLSLFDNVCQQRLSQPDSFKLETPGFPSITEKYRFKLTRLPKILVETKQVVFTTDKNNQIIYTGPALILDSEKSFDWKNQSHEDLRSWFFSYLSPSNPLVQFNENFFGNYSSPKFVLNDKIVNASDFTTQTFLRLKLSKSPQRVWSDYEWVYESDFLQSFFVPFQSSLHVPVEQSTSDKIFTEENIRGITISLSKNQTQSLSEEEHFLPLVQLKQPLEKQSTETTFDSYGYTSFFDFGVKGNPDLNVSPIPLNQKNFTHKLVYGCYKKLSSVFAVTKQSTDFVQLWEPLTWHSWLVVSQLSFALLSFRVLKELADNYGRELLGYLLDLVAALGFLDDSLKKQIELLTGQRNKGFRVVLQSRKTFTDIVGIQKLLLEMYEVVLFLRNSGRDFSRSQTLPHGVLLTGPAGTGKTLLVQALAGEAQVPVIVLSGSSLIQPREPAGIKLQMVFEQARKLAPCIVFIDEIDTLSGRRSQIVQNPMATDQGFESFLESLIFESKNHLNAIKSLSDPNSISLKKEIGPKFATKSDHLTQQKSVQMTSEQQEKQLSLLSQLLVELDGIQGRDGVVVFGATNRPEVLDPALLRPGRFDKIVEVGLPHQQKRVEILQFYGKNLGYEKSIRWDYLGERTVGFTAADLATLMNESTIKAILNQTSHTIETIDHGIDRLTTSESDKYLVLSKRDKNENNISISAKKSILRLAYYQVGKIILSYVLKNHPKSFVASLWPRRPTIRSVQITTNLERSLFEISRVSEITDRIVGCYAGKAAEFLFLQKFSPNTTSQLSTLGLEDLVFGQKLIYFLIDSSHLYSKKSLIQETIVLSKNLNFREFRNYPEKLEFYNQLVDKMQLPPMWEAVEAESSALKRKKDEEGFDVQEQIHYSVPWWNQEISDELEFRIKNAGNGSRLFLYNPERTQRNPEWFPPDEFYHGSTSLKDVKKAFSTLQQQGKNTTQQVAASSKTSDILETVDNSSTQDSVDSISVSKAEKSPQKPDQQLARPDLASLKEQGETTAKPSTGVKNSLRSKEGLSTPVEEEQNPSTDQIKTEQMNQRLTASATYVPWNDISKLPRDYLIHSLLLESVNKALRVLNKNRELLDKMVIDLIYKEILRKSDIENLVNEFELTKQPDLVSTIPTELVREPNQKVNFVELSWGEKSTKPLPKWIDFATLQAKTT
jgi:ATP-dependent Zn protease|nr:FtsH [Chlorella variabilis]